MAFKLTKADTTLIDRNLGVLVDARRDLDGSIDDFNRVVAEAYRDLSTSLAAYNEAKNELGGTFRDIHGEQEAAYDEKSDNWREGERGVATEEWISTISQIADDLETDLVIPEPEEIEINDETDFQTFLEDFNHEPSYA